MHVGLTAADSSESGSRWYIPVMLIRMVALVLLIAACEAVPAGAPAPSGSSVVVAPTAAPFSLSPTARPASPTRTDADASSPATGSPEREADAGTYARSEMWRGLVIAPEHRCSPYDPDGYPYPQSVERRIVARSEAHDSGLCKAPAEVRRRFASHLLNLTLASPSVNRWQKSGKDVAEYLPDLNRCWFANRVVEVRTRYDLTVDRRERDVLGLVLSGCASTEMVVLILVPQWRRPPSSRRLTRRRTKPCSPTTTTGTGE